MSARILFYPVAFLAIAACAPEADDAAPAATDVEAEATSASAEAPVATAEPNQMDWAGRWIGVEGMYLEVRPVDDGKFELEMQSDLDTNGTYMGEAEGDGIAFERGGEMLTLRPATGDETGLKYLAGKQDCLMLAEGEGYCRD